MRSDNKNLRINEQQMDAGERGRKRESAGKDWKWITAGQGSGKEEREEQKQRCKQKRRTE